MPRSIGTTGKTRRTGRDITADVLAADTAEDIFAATLDSVPAASIVETPVTVLDFQVSGSQAGFRSTEYHVVIVRVVSTGERMRVIVGGQWAMKTLRSWKTKGMLPTTATLTLTRSSNGREVQKWRRDISDDERQRLALEVDLV